MRKPATWRVAKQPSLPPHRRKTESATVEPAAATPQPPQMADEDARETERRPTPEPATASTEPKGKGGSKTWLLLGGWAVAAGAALALTRGDGDAEDPTTPRFDIREAWQVFPSLPG